MTWCCAETVAFLNDIPNLKVPWGQYTCSAHLWQSVASRVLRDGMLCTRVTPCSLCYIMPVSKYFVLALRRVVSGWSCTDSSGDSRWTCAVQEVAYGTCMPSHASCLYGKCIAHVSCTNFGRNVCDLDSFPTSSSPPAKCRCIRLQLKCDGTRWRTGGEVKGKLANGVGSQYLSHYLGTRCTQHYYSWCAHHGCQ